MRPEVASNSNGSKERPFVPHTPFCLRVTFSYNRNEPNGGVRLAHVERVRAIPPGIATAPPQPGQSGAWFEVHDAAGKLLYYRHLHDPIPTTQEVFADASGRPDLSRLPDAPMQGEFTLLVPDLPTAEAFVFHATTPAEPSVASLETGDSAEERISPSLQPAQERVRMTFEELRQRSTVRL